MSVNKEYKIFPDKSSCSIPHEGILKVYQKGGALRLENKMRNSASMYAKPYDHSVKLQKIMDEPPNMSQMVDYIRNDLAAYVHRNTKANNIEYDLKSEILYDRGVPVIFDAYCKMNEDETDKVIYRSISVKLTPVVYEETLNTESKAETVDSRLVSCSGSGTQGAEIMAFTNNGTTRVSSDVLSRNTAKNSTAKIIGHKANTDTTLLTRRGVAEDLISTALYDHSQKMESSFPRYKKRKIMYYVRKTNIIDKIYHKLESKDEFRIQYVATFKNPNCLSCANKSKSSHEMFTI